MAAAAIAYAERAIAHDDALLLPQNASTTLSAPSCCQARLGQSVPVRIASSRHQARQPSGPLPVEVIVETEIVEENGIMDA